MKAPESLRAQIAGDLRPVTPLAPPWQRTLAIAPLALALLGASVAAFGLRVDAPRLGPGLTWIASVVEMCVALALCGAALREAVPGTRLPRRTIVAAVGVPVALVLGLTFLSWSVSPTRVPPIAATFVWQVCVGATVLTALPPLALCAWLVGRAFALRPVVAGAFYGLGSGLMADAGWRLFCHYSHPVHVLGAHVLAVAIVTALGAMAGHFFSSRRGNERAGRETGPF